MILTALPKITENPKWSEKHARDGKAIKRRVEKLGKLNDRRLKARGEADRWALIEISYEYAAIGCPRLANEVVAESENL